MNKNTKDFWPSASDINWYYSEEESSFDVEYGFDYERAGITANQYRGILIEGIDSLMEKGSEKAAKKLEDELKRMGFLD